MSGTAYGPQFPDQHDLYRAQDRPLEADQAGCSEPEYQRLVTERQQTELAYLTGYDAATVLAYNDFPAIAQRVAEREARREAEGAASRDAWAALTPAEQEAELARQDAEYEAHSAQLAAEAEVEDWYCAGYDAEAAEYDVEPEAGL
jgi:hypothetical protein